MLRKLTIGMLMTVAAAAGFYVPRFMQYPSQADFKFSFPDTTPTLVRTVAPNVDYGCNVITEAVAYENRLDGPTANARSGTGANKIALKIANDGKGIFLLNSYDVGIGATDAGDPIPITLKIKDYIVASSANGLEVKTLILNEKTLKAVFSFTGQGMLGIKGYSLLLACH